MRLSGTLRSWNDDRGFGFIAPANGTSDVFLHISALPRDGTRPTVGERLSYEIGRSKDGKPQAMNVIREAFGDTRHTKRKPSARPLQLPTAGSKTIVLVLLLALGAYGYKHYVQKVAAYSKAADIPSAVVQPAIEQVQPPQAQNIVTPGFQCDGRTHCSQMTSCAEAKYFLQHCPNVEMDGNHDGTPCEQQWCASPFAK